MFFKLEKKLKKLPDKPGVYLFYTTKKELIYVGKATSLRSRVRSYFYGKRSNRPIEQMIHEVVNIKIQETESVLEAIVLEGNFIKKYRPKYNIDWKDDKSWNYIGITTDVYPQVKTMRSHEFNQLQQVEQLRHFQYLFGPFPGMKTREMMKLLQKLFFISTCRSVHKQSKQRPCLYYQMGQCLGVCTGEISAKDYRHKVIRPLTMFLRGNKKGVIKNLEKEMQLASKQQYFEEAMRLRNQIAQLQHIQDVVLLNKSFVEVGGSDRSRFISTNFTISRIEGYDISNFGTTGKVGSMVVFEDGEAKKSDYRKFKIKTVEGQSDVACLEEVLRRRLRHDEWELPDIFLIDGGKPQVNRVMKVLKEFKLDIPVVGIAKGPERKRNDFIYVRNIDNPKLQKRDKYVILWMNNNRDVLIRVRDEAHRFAISYQRKLRSKM